MYSPNIPGSNKRESSCSAEECVNTTLSKMVKNVKHDIAVLEWKEPLTEVTGKMNIGFINRTRKGNEIGKNCYIAGWGRIKSGKHEPYAMK